MITKTTLLYLRVTDKLYFLHNKLKSIIYLTQRGPAMMAVMVLMMLCFQCKTIPVSLSFSPDGKLFVTLATDRKVCIIILHI